MTTTRKQQSVAEKVAAESPYARAAAVWVAEKVGRDPDRIRAVNFHPRNASGTWWPGMVGLSYLDNGRERTYAFDDHFAAGQLECFALLASASAKA